MNSLQDAYLSLLKGDSSADRVDQSTYDDMYYDNYNAQANIDNNGGYYYSGDVQGDGSGDEGALPVRRKRNAHLFKDDDDLDKTVGGMATKRKKRQAEFYEYYFTGTTFIKLILFSSFHMSFQAASLAGYQQQRFKL